MVGAFGAEDGPMMGAVLAVMGFVHGLPSVLMAWTLPDEACSDE